MCVCVCLFLFLHHRVLHVMCHYYYFLVPLPPPPTTDFYSLVCVLFNVPSCPIWQNIFIFYSITFVNMTVPPCGCACVSVYSYFGINWFADHPKTLPPDIIFNIPLSLLMCVALINSRSAPAGLTIISSEKVVHSSKHVGQGRGSALWRTAKQFSDVCVCTSSKLISQIDVVVREVLLGQLLRLSTCLLRAPLLDWISHRISVVAACKWLTYGHTGRTVSICRVDWRYQASPMCGSCHRLHTESPWCARESGHQ